MLAGAWRNEEREKYMNFLPSYAQTRHYIFTRKDRTDIHSIDDLTGKRLAMIRGYATEQAIKDMGLDVKFVYVDNLQQAMDSLIFGKADAYIGDGNVVLYYLQSNTVVNIGGVAPAELPIRSVHMTVRKDLPVLTEALNQVLTELDPGKRADMHQRWLRLRPPESIDTTLLWQLGLAMALILLLTLGWILVQRRQQQALPEQIAGHVQEYDFETALERLDELDKRVQGLASQQDCDPNELFARLRELLEDDDAEAAELIPQLRSCLNNSESAPLIDRLETNLGDYDFEAALETLSSMQKSGKNQSSTPH